MKIREFADTQVLSISADAPLLEIIKKFTDASPRFMAVIGANHEVVGVIAGKDVLKCLFGDMNRLKGESWDPRFLAERGKAMAATSAKDIMSGHVISTSLDEDILKAMAKMITYRVSSLPIIEGGRLTGRVDMEMLSREVSRVAFLMEEAGNVVPDSPPAATKPQEEKKPDPGVEKYAGRRIYDRKAVQLLVHYQFVDPEKAPKQEEGTKPKVAVTIDISASGMFFKCHEPIPAGAVLDLSFEIPQDKSPVVCTARVVHTKSFAKEAQHQAGVEFLDISTKDRKRVDTFVKS